MKRNTTGAYRAALRAARGLARIAPELNPRVAATVRENMRLALGRVDPQLVRAVYRHFSQAAVDVLFFGRLFDRARRDEHFRFEGGGLEHCREHGGNGAIFVTGHIGNWELFNAAYHYQELPVSVIVRKPDLAWFARRVGAFRKAHAACFINKQDAARASVRELRNGGRLCLLMDQAAGRHGIPAPFFGRTVSTFPTAATLAQKFSVPVYAGYAGRAGDGIAYRCRMEHIPMSGDIDADTAGINAVLERYVREVPEQWWWFHRRFKPRRSERRGTEVSAAGVPLPR